MPEAHGSDLRTVSVTPPVHPNAGTETLNTIESASTPPTQIAVPILAGRYQVLGEIGRGGMGEVLRVHDPDFGRALALKVMLAHHARADAEGRFLEEARITGRLQHPGIPPVHEIGKLDDGRPFFAMKLIEGRTLSEYLKERRSPAQDLPRFIAIFGQLSQAVAYAHTMGVLHRDLKPSNVMVGAFGEVQVMDWGLAKQLRCPKSELRNGTNPDADNLKHDGSSELTRAGSILGTPAYMPPEQARGQVERVDERADVFGLGAILCVVLTGQPPYEGHDPSKILQRATMGDLASAYARLDACGADPELIALARRCLTAEREQRPRAGAEVAESIQSYLNGVQERLKQAEVDRARAEVQRVAERTRRRFTVALAIVGLIVVALGGLAAWLVERRNSELEQQRKDEALREAEEQAKQARREYEVLQGVQESLNQAADLRQRYLWDGAEKFLTRAEKQAGDRMDLLERIQSSRAILNFARQLDRIRQDKMLIVEGRLNETSSLAYERAFRLAKLDVLNGDLDSLAKLLTRSPIRAEVVAALDDWGFLTFKTPQGQRLLRLTTLIHPEQPWREAGIKLDVEALTKAVHEGKVSPSFLSVAGPFLKERGIELMRETCLRYPADPWLRLALANQLMALNQHIEAIVHLHAARAARPDSAVPLCNLGIACDQRRDFRGAIAAYRLALELDPKNAPIRSNLAIALRHVRDLDGAIEECHRAIAIDPKFPMAHSNLGLVLAEKTGDYNRALPHYLKALELDKTNASIHVNLGVAYRYLERYPEAIKELERALELDPKKASAHSNLGLVFAALNDLDRALASSLKAVEYSPRSAAVYGNLGYVYLRRRDLDAAISTWTRTVELDPEALQALSGLAELWQAKGELDKAISYYRRVVDRDPTYRLASFNLGMCHLNKREAKEALPHLLKAHDIDPQELRTPALIGMCHKELGHFEEALVWLERFLDRARADHPNRGSALQDVKRCKAMLEAQSRLPDILAGKPRPSQAVGLIHLAMYCREYQDRHALAVSLYRDGFAASPGLADDMTLGHRFVAACSAVRAAAGEASDAKELTPAQRAALRKQALDWLQLDLKKWNSVAGNASFRDLLKVRLNIWLKDRELDSVRGEPALLKLPDAERDSWRKLWTEFAALTKKVS